MGLIEPLEYGENFHELYTNASENRKFPLDKKSRQKKKKPERKADSTQSDQFYPAYSLANIELEPNASKFAVFSAVRSAVLEADTKYALFQEKATKKSTALSCCYVCGATCQTNNLVECACHASNKKTHEDANSEEESETEEITEKEPIAKVPQIVGAGLRSLFELIGDARNVQPNLCTKALKALLDVIQGQHPESFKYEPDDLINPLYDLLLDLATLHSPVAYDKQAPNSNWSSIACSALLGLCVARGDTGKILKAIAALLMSPKLLSTQIIQLPLVLSFLQRTVISAALNRPSKPDFYSHGIPKNSLIDEFSLETPLAYYSGSNTQPTMASDGKYIYLLVSNSLFKVGSGFNGTFKGHIYGVNSDFDKDKNGWLGYCAGKLYFKRLSKRSNEPILIVNTENLSIMGSTHINVASTKEGQNFVLFTDEDSINSICTAKDDSLVVKQLFTTGQTVFELPLKLARKKFRTLGYAAFEDEILNQNQIQKIQSSYNMFEPKIPNDIDIQGIACGKEFGIVRATNGKVYYYGKSGSLGLKSVGRTPTMKMTELIVSKVSNIIQVAVGHDGIHALFVNDDGTVYFAGTARRGEDGDNSKNRRQPKAVKPKKLSKVDGHVVIQAACNNGTSAFVTKTGKLIMFGKDTAHCDSLGFVTDLIDQHITKVALGKAHCVALNSKGQLFTFGLNNKGQCGRVFTKEKESTSADGGDHQNVHAKSKYDFSIMCDFDDHTLVSGQCRVCSVCKECTGYNISCVTSLNVAMEERIGGALCPCGQGDAGCSKCGACSACISLQEGDMHDNKDNKSINLLTRQRSKSLILRKKDKKVSEENNPPSDAERDPPRVAPLAPQRVTLPTSSPVVQISCGLHHTVVLTLSGEVYTFGSNQYGQLGTGDLQPVIGPIEVKVQGLISQVAAGSNHTVLLTYKGMVYTFGNYQKGQLGRLPNDFHKSSLGEDTTKETETTEDLAANIAAQRQKFLWNCTPGAVFGLGPSFGKKATWIGAGGDQTFIKIDESLITSQMLPKVNIVADKRTILLIPTVPLPFHTLAINRRDGSCVAHYKSQVNFIKMIQSNTNKVPEINQNVNQNILVQSQDQMSRSVHEARNQIFELQENQNLLAEQRKRRKQENKSTEKTYPQICFSLDTFYNVLWVFDGTAKKLLCYNVIAGEISQVAPNYAAILSPELALSQKQDTHISRSQASLNLLACLDILTSAQDAIPNCFEQSTPLQTNSTKESQSNEYQIVNRFENFGGGWGYSGHSVEAIRFMSDTDVMICGFGMFGGRGEYSCKLKVFDLGAEGGGYEKDGVLISETKEIPYECPARSKYHLMLPRPFTASAGRWYLVWARIAGPSSDCGSSGQSSVTTEDQIVFTFKSSKKANNGTDVNSGQIPSIIYRPITQETKQPALALDVDPVYKISKSFANTVTKECFDSIVLLLNWAWETFKLNLREQKERTNKAQTKSSLDHLVYVNMSCLRLLRKYINEIYPQRISKSGKKANDPTSQSNAAKNLPSAPKLFVESNDLLTPTNRKANMENIQLAECIGNVRALLIQMLCDDIFKDVDTEDGCDMVLEILDECHLSFVACFNAFYPTSSLKWNCLCDLLSQMDKGVLHSRLLSAILAGLCNPSVKLRATFSLLTPANERQSIISPSDNSGLPMLSSTENHQYPILVEQMIYRTQQEKIDFLSNSWTFKDVLLRLLDIICTPIRVKIENIYNRSGNFNEMKYGKDINHGLINNCCHLLARVLAEIVYQTSAGDFDTTFMPPRSLHSTGSRFARCDVSRTWNTGNFGPDAIAFTVDRSGIAIAGAMVYSGSGSYEYQLELLYDNSVDPQSQHKWETLESVSGSYDQDAVQNDMTEIKFERPVHIKENLRYALRLCSQGARTCSGDAGLASIRGPCGTTFTFNPCDLSFNGTTPTRGQIPCILYYSTPVKSDGHASYLSETTARDTALQIATDITKKCTELLILARNALAASLSPSDKSPNSPNNTQTIDSEHNITPIEEHLDITWANNSRNSVTQDANLSTARDITKRIGSFSKGIIETLKFDKRSTNPFDFEIEIGATEIHPKDLIEEGDVSDRNIKKGRMAKLNGNERMDNNQDIHGYLKEISNNSDSDESTQLTIVQLLELFNINTSNMFTTLLPLVYAHIGALACNDPKSSVQILSLIKEILPHVAALNQLYATKEYSFPGKEEPQDNKENIEITKKKVEDAERNAIEMCTTSNHYCIVESEHPYKGASLNTYRVEFPPCVQWMTVEFDSQCGTAQLEDYFLISIPTKPTVCAPCTANDDYSDMLDNNVFYGKDNCKNAALITSCYSRISDGDQECNEHKTLDSEWVVIKKFNTSSHWSQSALVLPGNKIQFSLETASFYAQDQQANKFGFKALVVGYDNPVSISLINSCLIRLEYELSYLGGMCSANLMKKDLSLPEDKLIEDLSSIEETLTSHSSLLSKGLALSDSVLTVNQALEPYLPIGSQSNERQFLKDFISGAPGSSGARLAAWLQPEPRLDPNKCELNPIPEPVRYGWPTSLTVTIRDQYGDTVVVPDLKVEIKAIPAGAVINGGRKMRRVSSSDANSLGGVPPPPRLNYEPTIKEKMCFKAITFMKSYSAYSFEELRYCSPIQTRVTETLQAQDMEDGTFAISWIPNSVGSYCLTVSVDGISLEEVYRVEVKEGGIPPPMQKSNKKPPSKLRKFVAKNSAGLRIRSHPTLQSEQLGIVKMDGIISFIDEIENDDGVWVRLSTESIRQHCTSGWYPTEAWCLQYNQHLGKTLLIPVVEPQTTKYTPVKLKQGSLIESEDMTSTAEPSPKPKTASPSKKGFDFSTAKFTPPLSSDSAKFSSTNPFIFTSTKSGSMEREKFDDSQSERDLKSDIDDDENLKPASQDPMTSSQGSNQSNIGSAIAGVVGGGASKLQALQKWFKGDSVEGKDNIKKKSEISDIASVSVRDLVKAIGGQESRSNGNGATPPHISRSSSPVFIPSIKYGEVHSAYSSSSRSVEVSDTSVLVSSLTRDLSQSPSQGSMKEDMSGSPKRSDSHTSQSDLHPTAIRLNSPKHSPRKLRSKRPISPGKALQGREKSNGKLPELDIKINQNVNANTGQASLFDQKSSSASTDNSSPPVWPPTSTTFTTTKTSNICEEKTSRIVSPPKRAMPPSLAESLRAVFAAFLWHEGIVHDAMACASFLKFHPSLPKEGALVVTRRDPNESKIHLSREQKAQQRHSVEVANAGNYLNIRPSTLETLTKSGNSSINNRRYRKSNIENDGEDKPKLHSLPEIVAVLPPALRCLVFLWEQVCSNCIQIVQTSALEQNKSSPHHLKSDKDKSDVKETETRKLRKKKKDDGSWCEFCEIFLPIPVTHHMRIVHPGCGKSAKGKGYNSVGIYCEGWAGDCGEGGKGASSWFLMCDICREKYMTSAKHVTNVNQATSATSPTDINLFGIKATSLIANSEIYTMMKENAIFLLELSSNTSSLLANQKRSPQQMPTVTEDQLNLFTDLNRPSTSRGDSVPNSNRNSRIGFKMNGKFAGFSPTPNRKSSAFPPCISPELMWQAPDVFSCLESLGASMNDDLPYEIFGINSAENCFERPLSEMSFDSCDPNASDVMISSASHATNTISRFHRSFSMVQGWSDQNSFGCKNLQQIDDQQQPKVVLRRRNNSSSEGEGSLLLCYPSENLRKLVPEKILSTSCIVQPSKSQLANAEERRQDPQGETDTASKLFGQVTSRRDFSFNFAEGMKGGNDGQSEKAASHHVDVDMNTTNLLIRPALAFIVQQHDLDKLRCAMKRSLRITTCRIYSLQALNWLVRSVTQTVCLHDLMWWFVASLSGSKADDLAKLEDGAELALEHPVSITQMSGRISQVLSQSLHMFLQSVADLTLLLPAGSSLQRIAIQCFGIKFRQADHQFLHSSHVFGNISKILSKSDEQNEAMLVSSSAAMVDSNSHMLEHNFGSQVYNAGAKLYIYCDLGGMFEVTVSSRQAMAGSLIDNSTETFWESDEEDRNKCKIIEVSMSKLNYVCKAIFVHIDNTRDIQNKVLNVVFFAGQSLGDTSLIKTVDVDTKACGWISADIPDDSYTHFRLEFRGPENTLRVRQIKLLGLPATVEDAAVFGKPNLKLTNAIQIQQRNCEAETLRVFRLLTGQVFGKLISPADHLRTENVNLVNNQSIMESSTNSLLADSLDLREHMVGILFSRSKLSHLQKQVIVHIVHAIRKEAQRAKEEWELSNASALYNAQVVSDVKSDSSSDRFRALDTYCFEMLSMVLALSGSAVGRSYLSHQHGLLKDLLSLLHTGSDRVQRQVTALLRRILPEISPESLGELLGVQKMPPTDFNIVNHNSSDFDMNRLGILDIFLAVIAKSLQLQIKIKTTTKNNMDKTPAMVKLCNCIDFSVHLLKGGKKPYPMCEMGPPNQFEFETDQATGNFDFEIIRKKPKDNTPKNLNQRWFLKGVISVKQAENIISLIRDMASGKLTEKWSQVTKAAIAESVLNLTRLDEVFRTPDNCVKTATLWLALASLCVLDKDHVEKLSSGQWSQSSDTRPMCSNHDDGETPAVIQCEVCGSLCCDCDRFLHLSRKTRSHRRTVCKEEEEAIRVELHESCGRTKLFWLLALADTKTLKGMVEFRDGSNTIISGPQETVGRCRFCGITGNSGLLAIGNVCADTQCQEHAANACAKTKSCGHTCGGVANEQKCLPCLQHVCLTRENELADSLKQPKLTQDADDMCMICFVEALSCAPSIQLDCGHVFHYHCCKMVLEKRWTGPRITFGFSLCPICKADIQHSVLSEVLEPINALKLDVKRKALMRLKFEGVMKDSDTKDLAIYAMDRYAYYVCFKCQKAYYGGEARCDAEVGDNYDPQELVCGACSDVARAQMCPKHGTDFLEYKCRYCCSVAVFFCFGTTHFCDTCHDDFQRLTHIPKNKLPQCPAGPKAKQLLGEECPLHVVHPPTGEEFALGCGICRKAHTF